ncbi:uncharacterized protein LOC110853014 [Folsomia candida]|uniref:Bifunctional arginine demethylase and lysyl-hydroxylase JMJD6 n=1 Tax=Folsomia candida TaxID=158441 RepID=A0A226DZD4_FOLCA|nr:uncharacterized protein LOC110853014 [Folsomia candida]OXA50579.1 hypothetical protein Fcan01_14641 [Folsomia candida]
MSQDYEDKMQQVNDRLLASCDAALARGLSPKRIQRTLHQVAAEGISSPTTPPPSRSRVILYTISILIVAPVVASLVVDILLNCSKILSSFHSRRCLLPSHPLLMEMVRPVAPCNFCANQELVELSEPPNASWFGELAYRGLPIILRNYSVMTKTTSLDLATLTGILKEETKFWEEDNQEEDECQFLPFRSPFTSLRHALDVIPDMTGWGEPWYIGWSNCHPGVAAKLRSLIPRPAFLPEKSESSAIDWIFIGSPGLGAAMHIDYVRRPSWQLQLSGVKTWELRPPPECETECPPSITFTIYPGDLLFLETNTWYHQTFVEGKDLSISIGSEYD